jgi:hypothetical protein
MNDKEFLEFWQTIKWPEVKTIHYRLYYDDLGRALFYSHDNQPGKYIDVTPEQFALGDMQVCVVDGAVKPRPKPVPPKLMPGDQGTPCYPNDVAVVVGIQEPNQQWKLKQHEQD